MTEFMLDIETLDKKPTAVILEIGIVAFDGDRTIDELLIRPDIGDQIEGGRSVSASTWKWWMAQRREVLDAVWFAPSKNTHEAAQQLVDFCALHDIARPGERRALWARGPQFDVTIVENFLRDHGLEAPWPYDSVRDVRTAVDDVAFERGGIPLVSKKDAHSALADCHHQIKTLRWARNQTKR